MKVYILESGCYSQRYIEGVYATPEAAMQARPIPAHPRTASPTRPPGWQQAEDGSWFNGLDWDEAASIEEYELGE